MFMYSCFSLDYVHVMYSIVKVRRMKRATFDPGLKLTNCSIHSSNFIYLIALKQKVLENTIIISFLKAVVRSNAN